MPQCYNPSLIADQDTSAFGKNSRYMKATSFNQNTMRRVRVLNSIENRFTRLKLSVLEKNTEHMMKVRSKARMNILESYKRTLAYRMVVKKHPIRKNRDYSAALNDNYSFHSLRNEIKSMLDDLDPDSIRQKKALALVDTCRNDYKSIITQNKEKIVAIVPKKPLFQFSRTEDVESRSPTPPPPPDPFRRTLAPPLRGLANAPQGITLKMVKEGSWAGNRSPGKTTRSPIKEFLNEGSRQENTALNPHSKIPAIRTSTTPTVKAAA